jgi:filamentous hemagglutinin
MTNQNANPPRVSNGVSLDPRLPDPTAGLGYTPNLLNSSNPNIANSHLNGYVEELRLANQVAKLPGETVISYGDVIGGKGADVTSLNNSSDVSLWDNKYRGSNRVIQSSPTFEPGSDALNNALARAQDQIENNVNLPQPVKDSAIRNLQNGNFTTNTTGSGSARNSVQVRFCNFVPC